MTLTKSIALTVSFRKWSRRKPWECRRCGAAIVDITAHARWHAHIEAGTRLVPPDPATWSEGLPSTISNHDVHVGEDGWDL